MRERGGGSSGLVAPCSRIVGHDCIAGGMYLLTIFFLNISKLVFYLVFPVLLWLVVCLFVFVVGSVCVIFFCVHPTPYVSFKSRLITLVRL